ncbi:MULTISPECIES: cobyric acid synthase [unclassified Streptomyces]|uniref:cobyric acid synthase n=1 Tax=unclassified Streptomyces TaxID=2593676 RepID=UPI000F488612|nr:MULTISPECIES: cobyric acid synthase [unclassified Streptomyces]MCX4773408.1 cobyric acid synthase [Streptomyces sp. NBC_01285]ROQ74023.1 adenosylcobyric acid synthase (glutamine-hydrolysing) [Streptomyces sp. CEV 2-1]
MSGGLLVAGTTSDAGKSVVTAGICRWLVRRGVKVAPFKAQNMSLNSFVTRGGAEIGRAQAMQAQAARVEPTALMNPVLLKPGSDRSSQVVLMGRAVGEMSARGYHGGRQEQLLSTVVDCLEQLRGTYDAVICEGAGSPAEINLRRTDIVNMGIARAARFPVMVVGDIDRGGVFASFFGTTALLAAEDQALIAGYLVNKFRGDVSLLEPGLDMLRDLTGRPTYGVLPFAHGLGIDEEDGLRVSLRGTVRESVVAPPHGEDVLRVAVCAVPLMSNFTDVDALAAEPGVVVRFVDRAEELSDADLVIVPGTRGTVKALAWLRERGLADALLRRAAEGRPVLGICGGYQILGEHIEDEVESRAGQVDALGLLPVRIRFDREKTLARPVGEALGARVEGYEIHHGVAEVRGGEPFLTDGLGQRLDGCRSGAVWGTHWHGSLESDAFRRRFLTEIARASGRRFVPAPDTCFAELREEQLDRLGDLIEEHADTDALWRLIESGAPTGLPFIAPGAPAAPEAPGTRR